MRECTTHHHACDCREAAFAEMAAALKWAIVHLSQSVEGYVGIYDLNKAERESRDDLIAATRKARAALAKVGGGDE